MPELHVTHSPWVPGDPWREPVRILDSSFFLSYLVFIDGRYREAARHVVACEAGSNQPSTSQDKVVLLSTACRNRLLYHKSCIKQHLRDAGELPVHDNHDPP